MNRKYRIPVIAILSFSLFSCKKSSTSETVTPTPVLQATIGGSTWTPDTVSATITYNATAKTKTFHFTGTQAQKQIDISIQDVSPVNNQNFTGGSYLPDANGINTFNYSTQIKNSSGAYVFAPYGVIKPGDGNVTVTALDSAGKTISGTFYFNASKNNYDSNGNIISADLVGVSGGSFKIPYQFIRQ
ncbi:hypothetical protein FPZ42_10940 [Mucilaginibacter achroorhodeus]|uniref:Uncharacterized protein n=1 Tax=Mucilaginibacter achroorhodeus TaxID=2599294 RepID=A0A563U458_9SPHI|nr:DUF6252 family protein [Mucilaginibacter achroorhodeus]TWR26136.1 hypothetical protein FPZ42_10940 [Mucilaginibacter achroorhodeus]